MSTAVFVISDDDAFGHRILEILRREGEDVQTSRVVPLDLAAYELAQEPPALVVIALPADPERALAAMGVIEAFGKAERRAETCVLAVGPASDPKLVLRALRGGIDDYLDQAELEDELAVTLRKRRIARTTQDGKGRLIAVLAPSGGSGSSTLAANVATVLAKEHHSTLLVDMQLQFGDLAALLDLKPTHTLADLCQNVSRMDHVLFDRSLVRHVSGVHLLSAPLSLADISYVTAHGVCQTLTLARATFPYVIVDLDNSFREEQTAVLRQADVILLVLRLDFAALKNAKRTIDHLRELGIAEDRLRLVVNRYGQPKEVPAAKAEEALGVKIAHYIPEDARSVNRSNNHGVPVVLEVPSARVSKSITKLAISVNGHHKKP